MAEYPTSEIARSVRTLLTARPTPEPGVRSSGRVAPDGPLEDHIQLVDVRTSGEGAAAGLEIVFEHRAFPGRRFGLRTGALWLPLDDQGGPCDPEDPKDSAEQIASWA